MNKNIVCEYYEGGKRFKRIRMTEQGMREALRSSYYIADQAVRHVLGGRELNTSFGLFKLG